MMFFIYKSSSKNNLKFKKWLHLQQQQQQQQQQPKNKKKKLI